jgi:GTP-dependent dephospho-CoA kinase
MQVNPKYNDPLKKPFGELIKENEVSKEKIHPFIKKSSKIITVGDKTTEKFVKFGFIPDLSIIDNKEKRITKDRIVKYQADKKIYLENRPGEVNEEAINLIRKITTTTTTKFNKIQIIVKGEEDLLALPLFMYSPDGWTIFYGQPNEGLVVVEIDNNARKKARLIFNKVFLP